MTEPDIKEIWRIIQIEAMRSGPEAAIKLLSRFKSVPRKHRLYWKNLFWLYAGLDQRGVEGLHAAPRRAPPPLSALPRGDIKLHEDIAIWAPPGLGIGAEIMYAGYYAALEEAAGKYTVYQDPRLVQRLSLKFPKLAVRSYGDWREGHQGALPILSAPWINLQTYGSLHRKIPSIGVSHSRVRSFREKIGGRRLIGVSWRTSNNAATSQQRSLELPDFLERCGLGDQVHLVSLQHGLTSRQKQEARNCGVDTELLADPTKDLSKLIDLIAACDEIYSTPNSVSHFAGALGKATTVFLRPSLHWDWWPKVVAFQYPTIALQDVPV